MPPPPLIKKITCTLAKFVGTWYNGSYTMMDKAMRTLELHYPMIQLLIILNTLGVRQALCVILWDSNATFDLNTAPLRA